MKHEATRYTGQRRVEDWRDQGRRLLKVGGPQKDHGEGRQQQADLEQVDTGTAPDDPAQSSESAIAFENSAIGEHRGHPGKQHEYLRGISEAEIVQSDQTERVAGDMIDKDHQQRDAAQYVNPRIALGCDY